ncbi:hypothetical protein OAV36_04435 [Flavobacteriales bacterium]|nr:hypothetical protein [Flavobacteriales bacterium]
MKKLMLCSILSVLSINAYSQDTSCTYFVGERVIEFNYYTDTILYEVEQEEKFYEIELTYGNVLCLDLSDGKKRFRKVVTEYFDGDVIEQFLDSKDNVYFSPRGSIKISVGKPSLFKI